MGRPTLLERVHHLWPHHGATTRKGLATLERGLFALTILEESPQGQGFGTWLLGQAGEKGWIGDLARAANADRSFPRTGDPDAVRAHLSSKQAESDMFEAVDAAEIAWLRH